MSCWRLPSLAHLLRSAVRVPGRLSPLPPPAPPLPLPLVPPPEPVDPPPPLVADPAGPAADCVPVSPPPANSSVGLTASSPGAAPGPATRVPLSGPPVEGTTAIRRAWTAASSRKGAYRRAVAPGTATSSPPAGEFH